MSALSATNGIATRIAGAAVIALAACSHAHAQAPREKGGPMIVSMTTAYMQHCTQIDDLLRKTCGRIAANLSAPNRKYCELPATPFATRTARAYAEFKDVYRAELKENEAELAKLLEKTTRADDAQFAQVRAGKISMGDLEAMSRELGDKCVTVEQDFLKARPGKK